MGLDGGYVRDRDDRKRNFELIVGRSLPEDGDPRYIGFVMGTIANRSASLAAKMIAPAGEHVLGSFQITMRITVLRQFAQGLENHDEQAGLDMLDAPKGSNGIFGTAMDAVCTTKSAICTATLKQSKRIIRTCATARA
jgi:hypothetical protein